MTHRRSGPTLDAAARLRRRVLNSRRRSLSFSISLSLLNRVWSSQHRADRDLAFASIAIAAPRRSQSQYRTAWSRLRLRRVISPLVEPSRLSLFLILSIWPDLMIFFSGFCLCFCIEEWMILYICLAAEKMWATSRKCVFYGIFKNTTKHQKIFSFPENSISEKYLFSGKYFTWTKHNLNTYIIIKGKCRLKKKKSNQGFEVYIQFCRYISIFF